MNNECRTGPNDHLPRAIWRPGGMVTVSDADAVVGRKVRLPDGRVQRIVRVVRRCRDYTQVDVGW